MSINVMKSVEELWVCAVNVDSVEYQWGEGYGETWDVVYPSTKGVGLAVIKEKLEDKGWDLPSPNPYEMEKDGLLELLGEVFEVDEGDKEKSVEELLGEVEKEFKDDSDGEFLREWREKYEEAVQEGTDDYVPMMNYYYPLPNFREDVQDAQRVLDEAGVAVVIVTVGDTPVLALSGGGMDLSEDICLAYMVLGYLPPFEFSRLDGMYQRQNPDVKRWLLSGIKRTAEVLAHWAKNRLLDVKNELKKLPKVKKTKKS